MVLDVQSSIVSKEHTVTRMHWHAGYLLITMYHESAFDAVFGPAATYFLFLSTSCGSLGWLYRRTPGPVPARLPLGCPQVALDEAIAPLQLIVN